MIKFFKKSKLRVLAEIIADFTLWMPFHLGQSIDITKSSSNAIAEDNIRKGVANVYLELQLLIDTYYPLFISEFKTIIDKTKNISIKENVIAIMQEFESTFKRFRNISNQIKSDEFFKTIFKFNI